MSAPIVTPELIAQFNHEVNRLYCELFLEDFSQDPWDSAPPWQRESAIAGVRAHLAKPGGLDPEESHNAWMAHKKREGWVWGAQKDPDAKCHPCMMPYDELPVGQRMKDSLFGRNVELLRHFVGKVLGW